MHVKVDGEYVDSPVMTVKRMKLYPSSDHPILIRILPAADVELTISEALALAADLIRAANRS